MWCVWFAKRVGVVAVVVDKYINGIANYSTASSSSSSSGGVIINQSISQLIS